MNSWALLLLFLQSVVLSYSGWGSVAVVRGTLVEQHSLITDSQLTTFLALSQITPGPLGFYLLFVGYAISGLLGAFLAWLALIIPSLLVVPLSHVFDRGKHVRCVRGATTGVIVASAALMLATAVELFPITLTSPTLLVIAVGCLLALSTGRLPSFAVVALAAVIGLIII